MNDGDLLLTTVCEAVGSDGSCDDETALAALVDWIAAAVADRGAVALYSEVCGIDLVTWCRGGQLRAILDDDGFHTARFPSPHSPDFDDWLRNETGFAYYLRTK